MTIASTRLYTALSALLFPCFTGSDAQASDRIETVASVTIVRSATVTVISNKTLLAITTIPMPSVTFTTPSSAPVTVSAAGGTSAGGGSAGPGSPREAVAAGGQAPSAGDNGGGPLVAFSGSVSGTTINGEAVSVSVGSVSGGSAAGSGRVPMVIAQYN